MERCGVAAFHVHTLVREQLGLRPSSPFSLPSGPHQPPGAVCQVRGSACVPVCANRCMHWKCPADQGASCTMGAHGAGAAPLAHGAKHSASTASMAHTATPLLMLGLGALQVLRF